jgi:hypothetical protein
MAPSCPRPLLCEEKQASSGAWAYLSHDSKKGELNSRPKVIAIIKEFFAPLGCHSGSRISKQMALQVFDETLVTSLIVTACATHHRHIDMF